MNLIKEFECEQIEKNGIGPDSVISKGIVRIQTELIRPIIYIKGVSIYENAIVKMKRLQYNGYVKRQDEFTKDELFFLADKFSFQTIKESDSPEFIKAKIINDNRYTPPVLIWCYNQTLQKEYILIEAHRWQFDYQPRGAGEDQLGEDVTYIHGIWENIDLSQEILNKI